MVYFVFNFIISESVLYLFASTMSQFTVQPGTYPTTVQAVNPVTNPVNRKYYLNIIMVNLMNIQENGCNLYTLKLRFFTSCYLNTFFSFLSLSSIFPHFTKLDGVGNRSTTVSNSCLLLTSMVLLCCHLFVKNGRLKIYFQPPAVAE